jgi:hypothetical protein
VKREVSLLWWNALESKNEILRRPTALLRMTEMEQVSIREIELNKEEGAD